MCRLDAADLAQVMFGGTNVNKDVAALSRGPPHILVRILDQILNPESRPADPAL